jgi:uracil-DNA glycosylase family 4
MQEQLLLVSAAFDPCTLVHYYCVYSSPACHQIDLNQHACYDTPKRSQGWLRLLVPLSTMSTLTDLYREIAVCQRCSLYKAATRAVPGEGPQDAQIMFIGEGPGYHEDQQGRPFVGAAGQLLDTLLASIDLKREQVYIANMVKHRPPGNRDPLPGEIAACKPWLDRQIEIIRPKMIVTLGRHSMEMFFPGKSISKIHGTAARKGDMICFAMYHPAAALHQQSLRQELEADMLKMRSFLDELETKETKTDAGPESRQLNLF